MLRTKCPRTSGTWEEVFGTGPAADEAFMAWHYARYVNRVAAAGKAEYPLPMYVNAALRDPVNHQDPNTYASGGPTWNVVEVWQANLVVSEADVALLDFAADAAEATRIIVEKSKGVKV